MSVPEHPSIGDPVVVDGTKYRIRSIGGDTAYARASFGGAECVVRFPLTWDRVARVWRGEAAIR
ncbi:MAG: hypothetical protein KF809_15015 [Chloroflexi bacterium]|nr:hypothetical protein [Chloroflexota bacterium]